MSKRNEWAPHRPEAAESWPAKTPLGQRVAAWTGVALVALTALLLQLPIGASAGIASGADERVAAQAVASASAPAGKPGGSYQLRCWQYGRLLFDEGPVTLSADSRTSAKLVATDRNGASLFVTDSGNTTCLARPAAPAPNPAMPR